jgi:hypothetical protein
LQHTRGSALIKDDAEFSADEIARRRESRRERAAARQKERV